MPPFEEYVEEIRDIWDTKQLTNGGEKHQKLEKELKEYLGVDHLTLFSNGHMALEGALRAFGLSGEVITTPFTFASTTNAIVRCGLKPVFCDIEPERYTIDVTKIEQLITPQTCAILPVHVYGNVCDVEKIEQIARKHSLKIIYDAAHAFGVRFGKRGIASYGDASIFSFHATKVYSTGEGGAVIYRDGSYKTELDKQKNFGIRQDVLIDVFGGNAKMSEFHAGYGLCTLRHIDEAIENRKIVYNRYMERLFGIKGIKIPVQRESANCNYAYFPIVFDGYTYTCEEILLRLQEIGVFPRRYFYPLTSDFLSWKGFFSSTETPIAKHISERILCLPIYPELTEATVDRICDSILEE